MRLPRRLPSPSPRVRTALLVLAVAWLAGQFTERGQFQVPELLQQQPWEYLSDRPWEYADTAWLMMGNEGIPAVDGTFLTGAPLTIGEHVYGKGFGVFTPSDISFQLQGAFARLEGVVGVEPDERPEASSDRRVRFVIYADGEPLLQTDPLDVSNDPYPIAVSLRGVQHLRLSTERDPAARAGSRAMWADMRVQRELPNPTVAARDASELAARGRAARAQPLAASENLWDFTSAEVERDVSDAMEGTWPQPGEPPVVVALEQRLAIVNATTAVTIGVAGGERGRVSVLQREPARLMAHGLTLTTLDPSGVAVVTLTDGTPDLTAVRALRVADAALGPGTQLSVPFAAPGARLTVLVTLFDAAASLLLDAQVELGAGRPVTHIRYETADQGAVFTGTEPHYLTNLVRLRYVPVHDDGHERSDYLGWTNPLYLYQPSQQSGLLLAALQASRQPPWFSLQRRPNAVGARFSLTLEAAATPDGGLAVPSLLVRLVRDEPMAMAFADYRRTMERLAPPPPLPTWLGPQWLSWYVYYMDITEELLVQQIDAIDQHFGDLGPWHIIVDAGWYWAEGREGAEWLRPDHEKFPRGLRWLVDYAHSRGVKVVLYFTGPYVNTNEGAGNWLGLRGLIEEHPEWVLPLTAGQQPAVDYVYDLANPELRAYLQRVFHQYWVEYGVDGMKLDGLGSAGESVLVSAEGGDRALSARAIEQTLDLYRLVHQEAVGHNPAAYIESGWLTPTIANQYAHTFRYGDEETVVSRSYPLPGLIQHIDYTAYQQAVLGQRSNVGAIWGEPNESVVNLWWLGAALALNAQVSVSIDLTALTPESVSLYRSLLAPYRPFAGAAHVSPGLEQEVFSTTRDGTHYVGIVNRSPDERSFTVTAEVLGLEPDTELVVFDTELSVGFKADGSFTVDMEPESFRLLVVRSQPGVLWANVRATEPQAQAWQVTAPPTVPGFVVLYVPPGGGTLYWDGMPLVTGAERDATPRYETLAHSSLIKVTFPPGGAHRLHVEP